MVGAQSAAKNALTVGASDSTRPNVNGWFDPAEPPGNQNQRATFSSFGPTTNGRAKPDLLAPGCAILSTRSQFIPAATQANNEDRYGQVPAGFGLGNQYAFSWGTGMATPLVAGCTAVIRGVLVN